MDGDWQQTHNMSLNLDFHRPDFALSPTTHRPQATSNVQGGDVPVPLFLRLALPPITVLLDGPMSHHHSLTTSVPPQSIPPHGRDARLDKSPTSRKPGSSTAQAPARPWTGLDGRFTSKSAGGAALPPPRSTDDRLYSSLGAAARAQSLDNRARFSYVTCMVTPVLEVDDPADDDKTDSDRANSEIEAAIMARITEWQRRRRQRNALLHHRPAAIRKRVPEALRKIGQKGTSDANGETGSAPSTKPKDTAMMTADSNQCDRIDVDEGFCEDNEDAHVILPSVEELFQAVAASRSRHTTLLSHRHRVLGQPLTTPPRVFKKIGRRRRKKTTPSQEHGCSGPSV